MMFRLAIRNLMRRKLRTILSILGVAIGVASMVAFTSIGEGFRQSLTEYFKQSGAQLMINKRGVADLGASRLRSKDITKVKNVKNVESTSRAVAYFMRSQDSLPVLILGRDPEEKLMRVYDKSELKENSRFIQNENEAMIGELIASRTNKKIGDTIRIADKDLKIVGIFRTQISWENGACVIHIKLANALKGFDPNDASVLFVYLKDARLLNETKNEIQQLFPKLEVSYTDQILKNFESQLSYVDNFVWIISLAALIVGCIGVLNTLLMSITERTREIGTLRAIGWSRKKVVLLILQEGFLVSLVGGIAGIAIGMAGAEFLVKLVPQGYLMTGYSAETFIKGILIALVVGCVGALYPAYRASKLQPAEALRYE